MNRYVWSKGSRLTSAIVEAQTAGETLEQLQEANDGGVTAPIVVAAARPVSSPLHPLFEWDDGVGAERYREHQARHVLAAIRVVQAPRDPRQAPTVLHAYVNLTVPQGDDRQRLYVPLARVLDDASLMQQALEQAGAELRALERRYAEFEAISRAVRRARMEIEGETPIEPRLFDGAGAEA